MGSGEGGETVEDVLRKRFCIRESRRLLIGELAIFWKNNTSGEGFVRVCGWKTPVLKWNIVFVPHHQNWAIYVGD